MRVIVYNLDGDPTLPVLGTTPDNADLGELLKTLVGVDQPYWAFPSVASLPPGVAAAPAIAADFTGAPLVSEDAQVNRNNVAGMFASPPVGKVTIAA